ncbi:MerR family transcriptional regulator [Streptomyces sp. TRM 70361]|uniref:MerR family transcriptional regulator n=1 Tax=Streptomyces sp. TRM 70361 TaxID=3116553 RepID=UPI002E7C499F|nr:MerR family transcriptional regulator [Streptomyces sp. TRM 70361]MEE1939854.1 MerR family transcriptional regulator [Streptomyces sp. TRM 70361]
MRIGELAALAGVTTRTVRHYHHLGLLPEPARRANGYREYGLRDAVALARVRRLTELGLSLDEVRDVLADDGLPDGGTGRELAEVLAGLDADLARQEAALRERRRRVRELLRLAERGELPAEGPVSAELTALFGELSRAGAELPGPEPAMAARDRELLALLDTAMPPAERARLFAALGSLGGDPAASARAYEVYALLDELADAEVDDPRVADAARAVADNLPDEVLAAIGDIPPEFSGAPGPSGGEGTAAGFAGALFDDLAPAQAAAVRQAVRLLAERAR